MKNLILTVSFFIFAASASADQPARPKIESLKQQISNLAAANTTNSENRDSVRVQLDALISELSMLSGPVNEQTWIDFATGSWQQIWSDERDNSPPGAPKQDLTQIYQFISSEGWGFNFGERIISETQSVTFALAVTGSVSGNQQTTEITQAFFRPSPLLKNESLSELSDKIRSRGDSGFTLQNAGRFPRGPIGAKGVLSFAFLDRDLKIGYAPNVFTGALELFVLRKVESVIK